MASLALRSLFKSNNKTHGRTRISDAEAKHKNKHRGDTLFLS